MLQFYEMQWKLHWLLLLFNQELFDYIAGEFAKFVNAHPDNGNDTSAKEKKLGYTWSHSVDQVTTLSPSAIKWKNFAANDTVKFA